MNSKIFGEIDNVTLFRMIQGNSSRNLKDITDGEKFDVTAAACIDEEKEGSKPVLFFLTTDGGTISTTSATAMSTFQSAVEFFGTHRLTCVKQSGQSKGGRAFVNLDIAGVLE